MENLFLKQGEVYSKIKDVNREMEECLNNYKGFEVYNNLSNEKEDLWKRYTFFKRLFKALSKVRRECLIND